MEEFYITEGHVFGYENLVSYFKWKIADLKNNGFTVKEIIEFDESEAWQFYVKKLIIEKS